jgi:hypothetical protein
MNLVAYTTQSCIIATASLAPSHFSQPSTACQSKVIALAVFKAINDSQAAA